MSSKLPSSLHSFDRRRFLRAGTVTLALPVLEVFSAPPTPTAQVGAKNLVAIGTYLGWHQNAFFPKQAGRDYEMPETLSPIADLRDEFTVFSGLDHRAPNGHGAWSNFLCGQSPKSYSLDQMVADSIGAKSRFPSIQLAAGAGESDSKQGNGISFTRQGVKLPQVQRPSVLYKQLFMSKADRVRTEYLLRSGQSSLDLVLDDARRLQKSLPGRDRDKLEEYFESFRAVEKRMGRQLQTLNEPVPEPNYKLPGYDPITPNLQIEAEQIMYDLMTLALETDSTRVISFFLHGLGQVFSFNGKALGSGYHGLSHHGNNPAMIRDLVTIETAHIHCFAGFLKQLKEKRNPQGRSLLDDTIVLLGTGMGDASRHSNTNLPTLVAGGGFNHGSHLAMGSSKNEAPLLGDLYITLMQRLGIEADSFSNASRNLNQLFS